MVGTACRRVSSTHASLSISRKPTGVEQMFDSVTRGGKAPAARR
jgi:hypothetical protein